METIEIGLQHLNAGRLPDAERVYRRILELDPGNPDALHFLGIVLAQGGEYPAAVELIRQAIRARPGVPAFHYNLGRTLECIGDTKGAVADYQQAINLAPGYGAAHYNLGVILYASGDYLAAEQAFRQVLALDPGHGKATVNLAFTVMAIGQPHEAVELLKTAWTSGVDLENSYRALTLAVLYDPESDERARFAVHQQFEERFARPLYRKAVTHSNAPVADRRLRVGWLSADFCDHPVGRNLLPILENRDRIRYDAICYADVLKPDELTATFQNLADTWRPINGLTDAHVADLIRSDGVDVLMVLAGRFDRNRPLVAAYRPAPIQVVFNDQATSGLTCMDYLIADRIVARRNTQEVFTERVLRLPGFYVHAPLDTAPAVEEPPALQHGYVTFGSFSNPAKVNDRLLRVWRDILRESSGSRLLLKYRNHFGPLRERVLASLGPDISRDRLDIGESMTSYDNHLKMYGSVDIALDTFPYSGSTTTFEALWMGVPVITLAGESMVSRWTASMLHAVGMDELIATSPDDYLEKAIALAKDPERIAELRRTLRARTAGSSLCNGRLRARQVERLLRAVWRRWCRAKFTEPSALPSNPPGLMRWRPGDYG